MKLTTQVPLLPERNQIDYSSKVLLLGSCFSENIGEKLEYYKFQHTVNPFGIVFHPLAIEKLVTRAINKELFTEGDIFEHNEQWQSLEVHSSLNETESNKYVKELNVQLNHLLNSLIDATHINLTFGTAWVYRHIASDRIVANCHKIPQKQFAKELLPVAEVTESIDSTIALIKDVNPTVQFITTVSPVRHLKDGVTENARSKAHLLAGLHQVIEPRNHIHYFPAYEIMMDELRDYRFYAEDLIHPNKTGIEIIWDAFNEVWISSEIKELQQEIANIQTGLNHKPFNAKSEAYREFHSKLQLKIDALKRQLPHLSF